jgi:hypothetical protein
MGGLVIQEIKNYMKKEEKIRNIERQIAVQLKLYEERNSYFSNRESRRYFNTLFIGHNQLLKLIDEKLKYYEKETKRDNI